MSRSKNFSVYENLDTSFVNLGALLRYLQERDFTGRIHVLMSDYEAEIRLRAGKRTQVREQDTVTGRVAEGEAALQRVLVRALDAGGRINVYSEESEAASADAWSEERAIERRLSFDAGTEEAGRAPSVEEIDWPGLLRTSAELIASVERAALSVGANFDAVLRLSRLELADDYAFLDPNGGRFEYAKGEIELHATLGERTYVAGVCETLRHVVEKLATGARAFRVRERVALELAVLVRRRQKQLAEFDMMSHLDRIAGTRVI